MKSSERPIFQLLEEWDGSSQLFLPSKKRDESRIYASREDVELDLSALVVAICKVADVDTDESLQSLLDLSLQIDLNVIYEHLVLLAPDSRWKNSKLHRRARWIVKNVADESQMKIGIFLLGQCGNEEDIQDLVLFSRHCNLTVVCADSISSLPGDHVDILWALAKHSDYGNREDLVWKLLNVCEKRTDIQKWLLMDGWDSQMGYCAAALATIKKVNFVRSVYAEFDKSDFVDAACRLLKASMHSSAYFCEWNDSVQAVEAMLKVISKRKTHARDQLDFVSFLIDWLNISSVQSKFRQSHSFGSFVTTNAEGWSRAACEKLHKVASLLLNSRLIRTEISKSNELICELETSKKAGLDLWEIAFDQMKRERSNWNLYIGVLDTNDFTRLSRVYGFVEEITLGDLILSECFSAVLERMQHDGPVSEKIIEHCLRTDAGRPAFQALKVIEERRDIDWSEQIWSEIRNTQFGDLDKFIKSLLPYVSSKLDS